MSDYRLPSLVPDRLPQGARLIDVRRRPAYQTAVERLAGATWIDPESLHLAHRIFAAETPLVFYCVHGHEVSQYATAMALVAGREAAYLRGGFEAAVAAGLPREARGGMA
ncbi:MAG: rhodanese-like domain-containing protein [Pseudomonadota bacterium]